ncbi:EAL domain-containing protein [Acidithiobacillus sp. AMEEHan]|uniref:bifunctional diguanylate cyclase/phosphodiesterase n=1 Tax=Acidithiobacillus sp. AMEEHan TaxID=2994951 RepID=UPI0027E42647|nr:EAL domain-containing protein [Acidithiobacillus sp. AMEEHan]
MTPFGQSGAMHPELEAATHRSSGILSLKPDSDAALLTEIRLPVADSSISARQLWWINVWLFLATVLAGAIAGLLFHDVLPSQYWPIWPAEGVIAYGILAWGPRAIPGLVLARIFLNLISLHYPVPIALWADLGSILAPWLGRWLLYRVTPDWRGFGNVRHALSFLLLFCLVPAFVNAAWLIAGTKFLTHVAGLSLWHMFSYWTIAQMATLLNIVAVALVLLHGHSQVPWHFPRGFALFAVPTLAIVAALFFQHFAASSLPEAGVVFLVLPFIWMLSKYPVQLVYPLASLSFLLALLGTSRGFGPYEHNQLILPEALALIIGSVLELVGLLAGAMIAERSAARVALERLNRDLERRVFVSSQDLRQRNRELQVRDAFLQSVTEINRLFSTPAASGLPQILEQFCSILVSRMRLAAVWIGHVQEGENRIELTAAAGPLAAPLAQVMLPCYARAGLPQSPAGRAIECQRTMLFSSDDPLFTPWADLIQQYRMGGGIYSPFSWPDGSAGVLALYRHVDTAFPAEISELLERLSADLAAFLRQRQVARELEDIRRLQKTMLVSGDIVLRAREAPQMLRAICDELIRSTLFNAAFIIRPDAAGVFQALALAGHNVEWILQRRWTIHPDDVPDGQSFTSRAWHQSSFLVVQDYLGALGENAGWFAQAQENRWHSVATLPIYHREERWAMLNVISDRAHLFNEEIIEVLQRVALLVGHALDEIHLKGQLSEERQRQSHLARHDALTGLANRRGLTEFLQLAMARARRNDGLLALAVLDLDDFKPVNDQYGHAAGDLLLQEVANRLRSSLRQSDHLARLGGDEFVLVWDSLQSREQIHSILEKIGETLAQPYFLSGLPMIHVRLSAGITFYPQPEVTPGDADLLLRQADHALYEAKENKKVRDRFWSFFADESADERRQIQALLRDGQLLLQYQPILDQLHNRIVGVEALARLAGAERAISPGDFLPFLSPEDQWTLTKLVLAQLSKDWQEWQSQGINLWIALNIPPGFLASERGLQRLRQLLADCAVPARNLVLEILESEELLLLDFTAQSIRSLQSLGYGVGLDDVGTGYASLLYLKELPVDKIKIDQAFVLHLGEHPNDLHFLRALLDLGQSQGLQVIVEGVENQTIRNVLRLMQVPLLQGFAIARPMFAEAIPAWLQERARVRPQTKTTDYDLLQLYAEIIDYQKTIFALVSLNPAWFLRLAPWSGTQCPIHTRLSTFPFVGWEEVLQAHEEYHRQLERITKALERGSAGDFHTLQDAGEQVLRSIERIIHRPPLLQDALRAPA